VLVGVVVLGLAFWSGGDEPEPEAEPIDPTELGDFGVEVDRCEQDGDVVRIEGALMSGPVEGDVWVHLITPGADEPDLAERWRAAAASGDRNAIPQVGSGGVWLRDLDAGDEARFELEVPGEPTAPPACEVVEILTPG